MLEVITAIEDCLDKKAFLGALSLALSIPDICGQVEYPEEDNVGKRYRNWYDKHIFHYENPKNLEKWMLKNKFDGFICYQLRNSIFHNGEIDDNIKGKLKEKYKVNGDLSFDLIVSENTPNLGDRIGLSTMDDTKDLYIRINVERFCNNMIANAKYFYKENKEAFNKSDIITKFDFM